MRKTSIFIGVLIAVLLAALMPATALAAKPIDLNAGGVITSITPGDVLAAGNSGRWLVTEREITGVLGGDIAGPFSLVYKANIESTDTQAGNFHGQLTVGEYVLNVNGTSAPLEIVPTGLPAPYPPFLPMLTLSGHCNFLEGAKGTGTFNAFVVFIPTPEGHVYKIISSGFGVTGQWQP